MRTLTLLLACAAALPVRAEPAAEDARMAVLTAAVAPDRDALWVLDRERERLAVYRADGGALALIGVRQVTYDFRYYEFPTPNHQKPGVMWMREQAAKAPPGAPAPAAPAKAQPPPTRPIGHLIMTKGALESGRDAVYVVDSENRRLAVYTTDGKSLDLEYVRDLDADLTAVEFPKGSQTPPVQKVRDATEARGAGLTPPGPPGAAAAPGRPAKAGGGPAPSEPPDGG